MFEKKNNGKELQPYDPENGEYLSNQTEKDELKMAADVMSGRLSYHPFPTKHHSRLYCQRYIERCVAWDEASCNQRKITHYLLSKEKDPSKENFFSDILGFNQENWEMLRDQILGQAKMANPVFREVTDYGLAAFTIISVMSSRGKSYLIRVGWMIGFDNVPRLITAYPNKPGKGGKHEIR